MQTKYYSVVLNITDGESSLPTAYIASVSEPARFDQNQLESALLDAIANDQGFSHNGEYYETVGLSGVKLNRIEALSEEDYLIAARIFRSFVCHVA